MPHAAGCLYIAGKLEVGGIFIPNMLKFVISWKIFGTIEIQCLQVILSMEFSDWRANVAIFKL